MRRARNLASVPQGSPSLFRWECGPGGEIAWVDGAPRGALIGRSISRAQNGDGDKVDRKSCARSSFVPHFVMLRSASPAMALSRAMEDQRGACVRSRGRAFRGYRGIALREQADGRAAEEAVEALADPDSLRELVHEIKTPLNAIIGFAEIIEGQYLGPADRRYRERAQEIVSPGAAVADRNRRPGLCRQGPFLEQQCARARRISASWSSE